jgi:hypothetical protein
MEILKETRKMGGGRENITFFVNMKFAFTEYL